MRLATLRDGSRDGSLIVIDRSGQNYASARGICATLQGALDDWDTHRDALRQLSLDLEQGRIGGLPLEVERLAAPLPRAYEWVDGSAYLNHILLVRKARGAEPPPGLETDPLVYQGDRKSTRLNSSHPSISYAVFCLKKKKKKNLLYTNNTKR